MTANQINYLKYLEDYRTHVAQETETHRANVAREQEQARANTLNYQASVYSTEAGMRNADVNAETQRVVAGIHAQATVASSYISAQASRYAADRRSADNIINAAVTSRVQMSQLEETQRHNVTVETETERHQKREDRSKTWSNVIQAGGNVLSFVGKTMDTGVKAAQMFMNTKARNVG